MKKRPHDSTIFKASKKKIFFFFVGGGGVGGGGGGALKTKSSLAHRYWGVASYGLGRVGVAVNLNWLTKRTTTASFSELKISLMKKLCCLCDNFKSAKKFIEKTRS